MRKSRGSKFKKLFVLGVSLTLCFFLLEWFVQWRLNKYLASQPFHCFSGFHFFDGITKSFFESSTAYGWTSAPNSFGAQIAPEFFCSLATDQEGRRVSTRPDKTPSPAKNKPLIVAIGDSYTFGWGVEEEQSYMGLLRAKGYRTMNYATPGYNPEIQLLRLIDILKTTKPKTVIFALNPEDDFLDLSRPSCYGRKKPYYTLDNGKLTLHPIEVNVETGATAGPTQFHASPENPVKKWLKKCQIAWLGYRWIRQHPTAQKWLSKLKLVRSEEQDRKRIADLLPLMMAIINEAKTVSEKNGAKFLVVLVANKDMVVGRHTFQEILYTSLRNAVSDANIMAIDPWLDLKSAYQADHAPLYFPVDQHPTPRWHQIIADLIEQKITS